MKKFNKTTSVEMSVDAIAEMFLGSQHFLFDNRETFIESIIGTCIEKGTLGTVLMGFMGVVPECPLSVGQDVWCSNSVWDYHTENSRELGNSESREVGNAIIIEVNAYARECYKIQFTKTKSSGTQYLSEDWVTASSVKVVEEIV